MLLTLLFDSAIQGLDGRVGTGHSTYIINCRDHLRVDWRGGAGNATYIITWLSHLGFGWRGGKGSVMCVCVI